MLQFSTSIQKIGDIVSVGWLSDSERDFNRSYCDSCEHRFEPHSTTVTLFPRVFRRRWHERVWLDSKSVWISGYWFNWTWARRIAELSSDRTLHLQFNRMSPSSFWIACSQEYPLLSNKPSMFSSYLLVRNNIFCSHCDENQAQIETEHWRRHMGGFVKHTTTSGQTIQWIIDTPFTLNTQL